jgi:hypothetical protein
MRIFGALQKHTTDAFLFISHTTNVPLFKFRCNIFIGVRIIKEMPGSVESGTLCIRTVQAGLDFIPTLRRSSSNPVIRSCSWAVNEN